MHTLTLNDGYTIPQLGFGTWKLQGTECTEATRVALENDYRHIDTAYRYQNHQAIAKAIDETAVDREDIYLTTKIWREQLRPDDLKRQFSKSLEELKTSYIDLLLVHWPNSDIPIKETYAALKELKENGQVHSIGVSNFTIEHLQEAVSVNFKPAVNQVEFHPSLYQKELWNFCIEQDIQLVAYSPLAQGDDIKHESVQSIARKHNATPAQIIISWILHKQIVAIPRSASPEHIKENMAAINITMDAQDMHKLDELGGGNRLIEPTFAEFP